MVETQSSRKLSALQNGVTSLSLRAFRNYHSLSLHLDTPMVILTGLNGAGKTNILEALSFFIPGRGLRRMSLREIGNFYQPQHPWAVSARIILNGQLVQLGTGLDADAFAQQHYRRVVNIQGVTYKSQAILSEYMQVLWLTPQMDRLFIDGSSERRNFLDRLVFNMDPSHSTRLNRYEHAARERMRLLKDGNMNPAWLDGLEEQIAAEGIAIEVARLRMVEALKGHLQQVAGFFPEASISLQSNFIDWLTTLPAVEAEDKFRLQLVTSRQEHAKTGRMTIGIQRSDLVTVFIEKNMPAAYCSTGEQKALLISLVLAAARYLSNNATGVPLLLLDEIVAHLDKDRRLALFQELECLNIQTWLTGTEGSAFKSASYATRFNVCDGRIE